MVGGLLGIAVGISLGKKLGAAVGVLVLGDSVGLSLEGTLLGSSAFEKGNEYCFKCVTRTNYNTATNSSYRYHRKT